MCFLSMDMISIGCKNQNWKYAYSNGVAELKIKNDGKYKKDFKGQAHFFG